VYSERHKLNVIKIDIRFTIKMNTIVFEQNIVQWLSLVLSKGPNRVRAPIILSEDGNSSSFRNVVLLETLDDGQIPKKKHNFSKNFIYLVLIVHIGLLLSI
jgi:hypothetical protein